MITVTIHRSNDSYAGFKVVGHAGYAEEGYDIICAAVSVLVVNAVNSIETFTDDKFAAREDHGIVELILEGSVSDKTTLLLDSMILGLRDIQTQYGNEFRMHDFHFITDNPWKGQEKEIDITFKIRHTPEFTKGKLIQEGERQFHILSSEKLQGIAPGQFGVIYDEEVKVCVGSGEIIC